MKMHTAPASALIDEAEEPIDAWSLHELQESADLESLRSALGRDDARASMSNVTLAPGQEI